MTIRHPRALLLAPLLAIVAARATLAWAADPVSVQIDAPQQMALGDEATITAVLRGSGGDPVENATVTLEGQGSFLSAEGPVRQGEATTDGLGRAAFHYQARSQGTTVLAVSFAGDSQHAPASGSVEIAVEGSAQLYTETAGVRVPGVGVWLLVGIVGGIWSTYFAVVVLLTLIARAPVSASAGVNRDGHE